LRLYMSPQCKVPSVTRAIVRPPAPVLQESKPR
jgi:hypothetical protein